MNNGKMPYISVIITAYDRKEFLLGAIKSVVNQTLDKKFYEIIVIKNFEDEVVDSYIRDNEVKNIMMQGTMGEFLNKGFAESVGEIVSFLDDDDLFFENKLDTVYKEFKKDGNLVYYHNRHIPINRDGETIGIKSMYSPDFNMSCISIKKSIVKMNGTDKINMSPDTLMYLYALESGKTTIRGDEKLTYYMFHDSVTNDTSKNFEEYKKLMITQSDLILYSYELFRSLFHSKKALNFLDSRITGVEYSKCIYGQFDSPRRLINYVINNPGNLRSRATFFLSCVLMKVYPKYREHVGNKMWNIHCERVNKMS